jgi:hypothetical protein
VNMDSSRVSITWRFLDDAGTAFLYKNTDVLFYK